MIEKKSREVISGSFKSSKENFRRHEIKFNFNPSLIRRIRRLIKKGK
jgi:hypothetical protein